MEDGLKANSRAALEDENLSNDAKYAFLKAECEIDGETWYWLHKVNGTSFENGGWYAIYLNNNRADWQWHYTTGTTVTSNSRIGVKPPAGIVIVYQRNCRLGQGVTAMTEETISTLLKPGERYRPDVTFDHTNRMTWCRLC